MDGRLSRYLSKGFHAETGSYVSVGEVRDGFHAYLKRNKCKEELTDRRFGLMMTDWMKKYPEVTRQKHGGVMCYDGLAEGPLPTPEPPADDNYNAILRYITDAKDMNIYQKCNLLVSIDVPTIEEINRISSKSAAKIYSNHIQTYIDVSKEPEVVEELKSTDLLEQVIGIRSKLVARQVRINGLSFMSYLDQYILEQERARATVSVASS